MPAPAMVQKPMAATAPSSGPPARSLGAAGGGGGSKLWALCKKTTTTTTRPRLARKHHSNVIIPSQVFCSMCNLSATNSHQLQQEERFTFEGVSSTLEEEERSLSPVARDLRPQTMSFSSCACPSLLALGCDFPFKPAGHDEPWSLATSPSMICA